MILIALIVVASTAVGVATEHRTVRATVAQRWCLTTMLYVLLPIVAFVNFAHLKLTVGAGVGLLAAWAGLLLAGLLAYAAGRSMGLPRPSLGALIVAVVIVNTGYLGYPVARALLGNAALTHAVVYDQVVSIPIVFTVGFGLGARFGDPEHSGRRRSRVRALVTNLPLWAALAGLIGGTAVAPHALVDVSDAIVDAFLVLGFFTVGVALSSERRSEGGSLFQRPDNSVLVALALRFSANPAVLALVSGAGVAIPTAYLLQAAMPSGINGLIIAHVYGLDQRIIATAIVWSTLAVLLVATVASVA